MTTFRRYYITSVVISGSFTLLGVLASLSGGAAGTVPGLLTFVLLAAAVIPVFRCGGFARHSKLAVGISLGFTIFFGAFLGFGFIAFTITGGGEGPNGEGSPAAMILAMALFGLFFLCPWLLTTWRGLAALRP